MFKMILGVHTQSCILWSYQHSPNIPISIANRLAAVAAEISQIAHELLSLLEEKCYF